MCCDSSKTLDHGKRTIVQGLERRTFAPSILLALLEKGIVQTLETLLKTVTSYGQKLKNLLGKAQVKLPSL